MSKRTTAAALGMTLLCSLASAQNEEKKADIPEAKPSLVGKTDAPKAVTVISDDGLTLTSVIYNKSTVLFSDMSEEEAAKASPEARLKRRFYIVQRRADGKPAEKLQLKFPDFVDAPTNPPPGIPYPQVALHLTDKPEPSPASSTEKTFRVVYPGGVTPFQRTPRGALVDMPTKPEGKFKCIQVLAWWGDGVTQEMVDHACEKGDFAWVCEGSGAGAPGCDTMKSAK